MAFGFGWQTQVRYTLCFGMMYDVIMNVYGGLWMVKMGKNKEEKKFHNRGAIGMR